MKMTYELLALQLDPNRRNGGEMEDGRGGGKEGGRKRDRAEEGTEDRPLETILIQDNR